MYVKIHKFGDREILAVCDEDIIGKTFEEKDLQINISNSFYKGEIKSDEEVFDLIEKFDNINLVGKKAVKLAIDNGIIDSESVIHIKGIPHAEIYVI